MAEVCRSHRTSSCLCPKPFCINLNPRQLRSCSIPCRPHQSLLNNDWRSRSPMVRRMVKGHSWLTQSTTACQLLNKLPRWTASNPPQANLDATPQIPSMQFVSVPLEAVCASRWHRSRGLVELEDPFSKPKGGASKKATQDARSSNRSMVALGG